MSDDRIKIILRNLRQHAAPPVRDLHAPMVIGSPFATAPIVMRSDSRALLEHVEHLATELEQLRADLARVQADARRYSNTITAAHRAYHDAVGTDEGAHLELVHAPAATVADLMTALGKAYRKLREELERVKKDYGDLHDIASKRLDAVVRHADAKDGALRDGIAALECCLNESMVDAIPKAQAALKSLNAALVNLTPNQMDAPGGPRCACGRPSTHESGWCGTCERKP